METSPPGEFEIYIAGGPRGESVVLRLPDGRVGIFDSFSEVADRPASNHSIVVLEELRRRHGSGSGLHFVGLSHPHWDHCAGIPDLLSYYGGGPTEYWGLPFERKRIAEISAAIERERVERVSSRDVGGVSILDDQLQVMKRIDAAVAASRKVGHPRSAHLARPPVRSKCLLMDKAAGIEVVVLGPQESVAETVMATRGERDRGAPEVERRLRYNHCSAVLGVRVGAWRGILTSDSEGPVWDDILNDEEAQEWIANANLITVPHHGSLNGGPIELWKRVKRPDRCFAVTTAFSSQGLPNHELLKAISELGFPILMAYDEHRDRTARHWESERRPSIGSMRTNWVRLAVGATGSVSEPEFHGAAGRFTPVSAADVRVS